MPNGTFAGSCAVTSRSTIVVTGILVAIGIGSLLAPASSSETVPSDDGFGAIEGVVIYEADRKRPWRYRRYYIADRKTGCLAEAVVSLSGGPPAASPGNEQPRTWTIDQKDYRFIPETLAVRAGDRITFTNSDPVLHDVTTKQRAEGSDETITSDSFSLGQRKKVLRTYGVAGGMERPVTLSCRFHSAMRGWIYIFDHPFFQVTEKEGTFRFEHVPPGKHRLVAVHAAGSLRREQEVQVKAGETCRIEMRVSPDDLLPAE